MDYAVNATQTSAGRSNLATGAFTTDDTAVRVTLGFRPRLVKLVNASAATLYEHTAGMGENAVRTVTAGTTTITNTSDIVIDDNGFTIRAAVAGDAQNYFFYAAD